MEKVDKKVLCYYIISYHAVLLGFDSSLLTDYDVIKSIEKLEQLPYDELLSTYEFLNNMFIEKFGFNEEE